MVVSLTFDVYNLYYTFVYLDYIYSKRTENIRQALQNGSGTGKRLFYQRIFTIMLISTGITRL